MEHRGLVLTTFGMMLASLGVLGLLVCRAEPEPEATPKEIRLPEAPIRYRAGEPVWTIALFVDLEATESRQAFAQATRAVSEALLVGGPAELRLLHTPVCPPEERGRLRCTGARAVECAEAQRPGTGARLAGAVMDLQWEPSERRTQEEIEARARRLGLDIAALRGCMAEDLAVEARLREHAAFARAHGLVGDSAGYVMRIGAPLKIAPFIAADTAETLRVLSVCLDRGRCQEAP